MVKPSFKKVVIIAAFSAAFLTPIFSASATETIEQISQHLKNGDYSVVQTELVPLAESGNARAEYNLGISYLYGQGVKQNSTEAFNWISKAAMQNDIHAEVNLASMYLQGKGVAKNPETAISWYQRAAEQNDAMANVLLAKIYRDGLNGKVDYKQAFQFFSRAEELGNPEAKYNLAAFYHYGLGVDKDENKARALFGNISQDNNKSNMASFGENPITN